LTGSKPKPDSPAWSGIGDSGAIWDRDNNRWVMFFQDISLQVAISTDPEGKPGTWFKYAGEKGFTEPGLGGKAIAVPVLNAYPGGNPSVHWNTYLKTYVIVWHGWEPPKVYISTSQDLVTWTKPKTLVDNKFDSKVWYPTLVGNTQVEGGQDMTLYYTYWPSKSYNDNRRFIRQSIHFEKE